MRIPGVGSCALFVCILAVQNVLAAAAYLTAPATIVSINGSAPDPAARKAFDDAAGRPQYPVPIGGEDIYSDISLRNREEGTCVLRLTLNEENRVVKEELETKSGFSRLDDACIKLFHGRQIGRANGTSVPAERVIMLSVAWMLSDPREVAAETKRSLLREQHKGEPHVVPAGATGRSVRIFAAASNVYTGDTIQAGSLLQILFTEEACNLPIEGAERMHRLWTRQGVDQVGCWFPTVDDKFVTIDGGGRVQMSDSLWASYPRALLQNDGTALIIEPDYDSSTFVNVVTGRYVRKMVESRSRRMNEAP